MNKRQKFCTLILSIAATTLLLTCCNAVSSNSEKPSNIKYSSVSWSNNYPHVDSLFDNADIVVRGKAVKKDSFKTEANDVFTNVTFEIEKYYKSRTGLPEQQIITVVQDGGIINDTTYIIDKVEIMENKKNYVLFLKYDDVTKTYFALTGYQGIYKIENGNAKNADGSRSISEKQLMKKIEAKAKKR